MYILPDRTSRLGPFNDPFKCVFLGLSRRQRKNRKREKDEKVAGKGKKPSPPPLTRTNSEELKADLTRTKKRSIPCKQYSKLNLSDQVR